MAILSDGQVRNVQKSGAGTVGNDTALPYSAAEEFAAPVTGQTGRAASSTSRTAPGSARRSGANKKPGRAATQARATEPTATTAGAAINALQQPPAPGPGAFGGGITPTHSAKYASRSSTRAYGRKKGRSRA